MQSDRTPRKWFALGTNYVRDEGWPRSPTRRKPAERGLTFVAKAPIRAMRWCARFLTAPVEARRLQRVYLEMVNTGGRNACVVASDLDQGLKRCDIRYINLDQRPDRRAEFEYEMRRIGVSWHVRVPATAASPGILGCGLSHTRVVREWTMAPGRLLLVCEDDAEFVSPRGELDALIEEFVARPELKILALANRTAWHIPICEKLGISSDIQTAAAYVAKPEIAGELVKVFDRSVRRLVAGAPAQVAAHDIAWKKLQKKQLFAVPRRRSVIQRAGYSDIQAKLTDYYGE